MSVAIALILLLVCAAVICCDKGTGPLYSQKELVKTLRDTDKEHMKSV